MQISESNAKHLARYLAKGIFEHPGTREVSISIGEDAAIGIVRRGRKYILCIKYKDTVQKEDMRTGFNENVSEDALADLVIDVIGNSPSLLEVALNMDKVPLLQEDVPAGPEPEPETHFNPPENAPEVARDRENRHTEEQEENTEVPGAAGRVLPIRNDELPADQPAVEDDGSGIPETVIPETDADEDDADQDDPAVSVGKTGEEHVDDGSLQPPATDDTPLEIKEEKTMITSENKVETAIQSQGLMPSLTDTSKFANTSYISSLLGDGDDIRKKFSAIFNEIASRDRELAVEYYIRGIYTLLPLMGNDIDAVAEATGIDKRDIVLSIYERPLFA